MKKIIKVAVLSLFALTIVLTGCAQSAGGSTPRPPSPPSGPTGPETPPDDTAPAATVVSIAETGDGFVRINWSLPADDYTAPADLHYKAVYAETAEELDTIAEANGLPGTFAAYGTRSEQFDDLVNDTPYYFAVITRDESNHMSLSIPVSATPRSGPSSACDILSISLESMGAGITSTGTYTADTYFFSFPPGTDITGLLIDYSLSPGAALYLEEDEVSPWQSLDMTDGLIVKVVAADGVSFQNYQLMVNFVRERRIQAFMLEHTSGGAPLLFSPDFSPDHRNYNTASSVAAVTLTINALDWMEQDFVLVKLNSGSWVTPAELNRHNFTLINGNNTISAKVGDDSEIIYSVFINASL